MRRDRDEAATSDAIHASAQAGLVALLRRDESRRMTHHPLRALRLRWSARRGNTSETRAEKAQRRAAAHAHYKSYNRDANGSGGAGSGAGGA